jgi:hypothetical protein
VLGEVRTSLGNPAGFAGWKNSAIWSNWSSLSPQQQQAVTTVRDWLFDANRVVYRP